MSDFDKVEFDQDLATIRLLQWCPSANGQGPATQVHLLIELDLPRSPALIIRFKSKRGINNFISDLKAHAQEVWPDEVWPDERN